MIYKDYIVEKNVDEIKENIVLFYGENNGKKEDLKKNIKQKNRNLKISRNFQNEILKNEDLFLEDLFNKSLFDDTKIYFIENVDDKILDLVQNFIDKIDDQKIYFFSDILDKKSKLRNYCEKNKKVATIACYNDNEISLRKIISSNLGQLNGLTPNIINIIINNSQMDRVKLNNELEKIKSFFFNKKINEDDLLKLLNLEENDDFQALRDAALNGNKKEMNALLNSTIIENEKFVLYLNMINQRLLKLKEVATMDNQSIEKKIETLKPPIFWKDKPNFIRQAKYWNNTKIRAMLNKTFNLEIKIKTTSFILKDILIKKLLLDICFIANA